MGESMKDFDGKGEIVIPRLWLALFSLFAWLELRLFSNEISSTVLDYSKSCFCWVCCDVVLDRIASVQ